MIVWSPSSWALWKQCPTKYRIMKVERWSNPRQSDDNFYARLAIPGLVVDKLMELSGGERNFESRLERSFTDSLFDMTNEPDIGYPWFFSYIKGSEWKTQKYVNDCIRTYFSTEPGGLPGNDDAGTLSAWLMYSMMGFYPICPGSTEYALTTPVFDKIRIKLDENYYPKGELLITTDKDPAINRYIKAVGQEGKKAKGQEGKKAGRSKYFISHEDLVEAGELKFYLTRKK